MPRPMRERTDKSSDARHAPSRQRARSRTEEPTAKKDVNNEGRTDYVHENKGSDDNVSGTKPSISAKLHGILRERYAPFCRNRRPFRQYSGPGCAIPNAGFGMRDMGRGTQRQVFGCWGLGVRGACQTREPRTLPLAPNPAFFPEFSGCLDGDNLKIHQVIPMADPALQQFRIGGFHNLETACPAALHPACVVGDALGEHPTELPEAFSDQRRASRPESFDDHEEHAPQFTADGDHGKTAIANSKFKIQNGLSKIEKPKIACSQLKIQHSKIKLDNRKPRIAIHRSKITNRKSPAANRQSTISNSRDLP